MALLLPTQTLNLSERGGMSNAQGGSARFQSHTVDSRIPFLVKPNQLSTRVLPMLNAVQAFQERVQQRKLQGIQNEAKNEFTEQANKLLVDYRKKKLKGAVNGLDDYNNLLDKLRKEYSDIFKNHRDFKESTDKWLDDQTTSYKTNGYDHYSNQVFKQNDLELQARITNTNIAFQNNATSPQAPKFYQEYQDANRAYLEFNGFDLDSEEAQVALTKANDEAITQLVDYNCNAEQFGIARNRLETFKNTINGTTYRNLLLKIQDGLDKQAKQAQAERDAKARASEISVKPLTVEQKIQLKQDYFAKRLEELKSIRADKKAQEHDRYKSFTDEQLVNQANADASVYVMGYDNKLKQLNESDFFTRQGIRDVFKTFTNQQLQQVTADNILGLFNPVQQDAISSGYDGDLNKAKSVMLQELDKVRGNIGSNTMKNLKAVSHEMAYRMIHDTEWLASHPIALQDEQEFKEFQTKLEQEHSNGTLKVDNKQAQSKITTAIEKDYGKKLENLEPYEFDITAVVNDDINQLIYNYEKSTGKKADATQVMTIAQSYLNDPQGYKSRVKQSQQRIDRLEDVFGMFKDNDLLKDYDNEDTVITQLANLDTDYANNNGGVYPSPNQLYNYAIAQKAVFLRYDVTYKQYEQAKKDKEKKDLDRVSNAGYELY